jgi:hypothetical protein
MVTKAQRKENAALVQKRYFRYAQGREKKEVVA